MGKFRDGGQERESKQAGRCELNGGGTLRDCCLLMVRTVFVGEEEGGEGGEREGGGGGRGEEESGVRVKSFSLARLDGSGWGCNGGAGPCRTGRSACQTWPMHRRAWGLLGVGIDWVRWTRLLLP